MTTITIELPDEIARQAAQAGLFADSRVKNLFEAALDDALMARELQARLAQLQLLKPGLTEQDIQADLAQRAKARIAQAGH